MRFELHCHTHYSRGRKIPAEAFMSPSEAVRTAKSKGLGGIAITDHITNAAWKEAAEEAKRQGIIFIPGIEIDTQQGHIIGLGLNEYVKSDMMLEEAIESIREQGGIAVAPHPFDIMGHGVRRGMLRADAVEAFNALAVDRASNVFTELLARRKNMPMVCGSDAHTKEMIGVAPSLINAQSMDDALREIKKGNAALDKNYVPQDVIMRWSRDRFIESYGHVLRYINQNYSPYKAWFSKFLLREFVYSKSNGLGYSWKLLTRFGIAASRVYSSIKMLDYL